MAEKPDYESLIRFLMTPFLDLPEQLKMDVERLTAHQKVWFRVAFAPEDRGRMFGRGGRNIQAIRTILQATASLHGERVSLDIYGESSNSDRSSGHHGGHEVGDRRRRSRPSSDRRSFSN